MKLSRIPYVFSLFLFFLLAVVNISGSSLIARGEERFNQERRVQAPYGGAYHPEARAYARGAEEGANNAGGGGGGTPVIIQPESGSQQQAPAAPAPEGQ